MQIVSNVALISINETFLVQLVSFLIFLFILNRIMIRPLRDVMRQRQVKVADIQQETVDAQAQMEESLRQIRQDEARMREAANQLRAKLEEEGSRQARWIVDAARSEVDSLRREAETDEDARRTAELDMEESRESEAFDEDFC